MIKVAILMHHAESTYWFKKELITALISSGSEVHVVVPDARTLEGRLADGVKLHTITMERRGMNPRKDFSLYLAYCKKMKEIAPDVILTAAIKPNIYGNLAAQRLRIPVISNITGLGSTFHKEEGLLFTFVRILYSAAFRKTSHVIFENQGDADKMERYHLVRRDQILLVSGAGVNTERFSPIAVKRSRQEDGETVFLLIGRLMKEKGIEEFLNAAQRIRQSFSKASFRIMGMVEEERYLKEIEKASGVTYLGQLEDPREEIANADCIVLPSYHEGMANVLLEGAAMEKPLIASDIPGCREAIEEGVTGFLCQPRDVDSLVDAMHRFLELDQETRARMGKSGRQKMRKEFDRAIVVQQYLACVKEAVQG